MTEPKKSEQNIKVDYYHRDNRIIKDNKGIIIENVKDGSTVNLSIGSNSTDFPQNYDPDKIKQEFIVASQGLLNWPRTLGNNQQIERPEFQQLLGRIEKEESSTTIILGSPGTGKSALLGTLGHHLNEQKIAIWGIKADRLGHQTSELKDLCKLYLNVNPRDAIEKLAKKEPVVVLIDQLDAISELLDIKSERLNVLLSLIQSLSGMSNVHVVATSREFEFRHDARLSCIKAERIDLQLPKWEKIVPLFPQNYDPHSMGKPLRELLQTPLHLKLFLEVNAPEKVFDSLQALLEELWRQRVVNPNGLPKRSELLELLAKRIGEDEEFWLPTAIAENDYSSECFALERAEILTRNQNGLTIGFQHQTYYDYTQARAFACGSIPLADYVLERQDGLFVRPTLLSGLNYLRATSPKEYHRQLTKLQESELQLHISNLLLEFVGEQKEPDNTEANSFLHLLESETEGQRLLAAVAGSPGWFHRLRDREDFAEWLTKPPEQAIYCVPLLAAAIVFAPEDVLELLEEWFENSDYHALSFRVLQNLQQWNEKMVRLASKIIIFCHASSSNWEISMLAEKIAEKTPELAPILWRSYLDWELERTTKGEEPPVQNYSNCRFPEIQHLIESETGGFHNLESLAEAAPNAFLDRIFPWFTSAIGLIKYESSYPGYYKDDTLSPTFEEKIGCGAIVKALLTAVLKLAKQNTQDFLNFLKQNSKSDLLIVHRLLARGLECIAKEKPQFVLEYLTGDARRLILGDIRDEYRETKLLIASVFPYLKPEERNRLETAVINFRRFKDILPKLPKDKKLPFQKWQRQHRLRLLRVFPEDYLSPETKRLKDEEERALPEIDDFTDANSRVCTAGAWMTAEEMALATDNHLLKLLNFPADEIPWRYSKSRQKFSKDSPRAGGSVALSHQLEELAKKVPERIANLIQHFLPEKHETYAGSAVRGLADADFPADRLIAIIEALEKRGFASIDFRTKAASALEKIARDRALPQTILTRLENWLVEEIEPTLSAGEPGKTEQRKVPIFFRSSDSFCIPQGRGSILPAIALGYLKQQPPDLENWIRFIEERLREEKHPLVWVQTLINMPPLLNGDRARATELFGNVIQTCPGVLRYGFALHTIFHYMRYFQPEEKVREWIEKLLIDGSDFCHQAYGELLLIYHGQYPFNDWSAGKIDRYLTEKHDKAIIYGLAQASSYLWQGNRYYQKKATEIVCALASHSSNEIQDVIADFFFKIKINLEHNNSQLRLNSKMKKIIEATCDNKLLLAKAANNLIKLLEPEAGREPKFVSKVCEKILEVNDLNLDANVSFYLIAENLTNIALTLHRQPCYRAKGLTLFEKLISLNLREARAAMENLDRKPNRPRVR